jgi:hypothetical protein
VDLSAYMGKWAKLAGLITFIFMMLFIFLKIMFNASDDLLSNDTL